jgi:hypothetical protein
LLNLQNIKFIVSILGDRENAKSPDCNSQCLTEAVDFRTTNSGV